MNDERLIRCWTLDCVLDGMSLESTLDKLDRCDPEQVRAHYLRIKAKRSLAAVDRREERAVAVQRVTRRRPRRPGRGITINELAEMENVPRSVMVAALRHAGYLTLSYTDARTRRHVVSAEAERQGAGHTVDPSGEHSPRISGHARAAPFAVFAPAHVPRILEKLGLASIRQGAAAIPTKRRRLDWLIENHNYLPAQFMAELAGATERAVKRRRARLGSGESSLACYVDALDYNPPTSQDVLKTSDAK